MAESTKCDINTYGLRVVNARVLVEWIRPVFLNGRQIEIDAKLEKGKFLCPHPTAGLFVGSNEDLPDQSLR